MRCTRTVSRYALVAAASLALPLIAMGQTPKFKPGELGPTLIAYSNGTHSEAAKREMTISALDISVNVRGEIAETTVTVTFQNPTSELLEGQFALNMPRGAVVTGYAIDINGTLIDGVLETKYKAAEAYQRRVAQRVDPGLAEVNYSDRFEARVYPIPARGSRTIRLRMASALDPVEGYVLPLAMERKLVDKLAIEIKGDVRFVSERGIASLPADGSPMTIEGKDFALTGPLKLMAKLRTDAMLVSEHPGAERFFDLVAPAPKQFATNTQPLHILWDRSVSRTDDELKEEAQLAQDMARGRGLKRVKITLFDSGAIETREVAVDGIAQELGAVRYRGGTSYAQLAKAPVAMGADCLMFSDGRVSIDDRKDFTLPCRIFSVASGPEIDKAWLSHISKRSGGMSIDLGSTKLSAALAQLEKPEAGIVSVTDTAGHMIEVAPLPAEKNQFHIAGPLPDSGPVMVQFAGEAAPRRFETPTRAPVFAGPGALWARDRLGVVAADLPPEDLAAMALRYNVATPQASFVVLETPNDYVQSDIEPPATYPKALREQYISLRRSADEAEERARAGRLDTVASLWKEQKSWWDAKYSGVTEKVKNKSASNDRGPRGEAATASAPPPPAPTSVARAAPAARGGADKDDNVVVTGQLLANAREEAPRPSDALAQDERRQVALISESERGSVDKPELKQGKIEVEQWQADRPYLKRLDKAGANWEAQLDKEIKDNGALPLFWFDVAEWHWSKGRKEEARRAAEAALDLPTRDNQTLAIVAAKLLRFGSHDRAIWLLERLAEREADRPQPSRTLALALIERSKVATTRDAERADLKRAVELLTKSATELFDVNARGVEQVTLMEANAALARLKAIGGSSDALDKALVANLDADVRVVMEWNTPRTDLDLWVTEPKGERVGYSSPSSSWGGKLSGDVTNGYGPEEYVIRRAQKGVYQIRANTFASDRNNPNGPSTLTVRVIRNFGRPNQTEQLIDLEMDAEDRGERQIGKITIE